MKIEYPIAQKFGENFNNSYAQYGMKGHNGIDYDGGYGCVVHSVFDREYVYKILTVDAPANDGSGFTGVFTIVDNGIEVFEVLYGHGDPLVVVGQICHRGDAIMREANHGLVFSGGTQITLEMQKKGDKRGCHVHLQKRILRKDKVIKPSTQYLSDFHGNLLCIDGYYFAIPFYNNGFKGCVDFTLPLFQKDLMLGSKGYDVGMLQRFLIARGFMQGEVTEYFGQITIKAVAAFQKVNNILPLGGYFGFKTRALVNKILE